MSPIGGVGINLAIQDAVATANLLSEPLRTGAPTARELAAVQRRRMLPVRMTQAMQVFIQNRVITSVLAQHGADETAVAAEARARGSRFCGASRRAWSASVSGPEHVRTPGGGYASTRLTRAIFSSSASASRSSITGAMSGMPSRRNAISFSCSISPAT